MGVFGGGGGGEGGLGAYRNPGIEISVCVNISLQRTSGKLNSKVIQVAPFRT